MPFLGKFPTQIVDPEVDIDGGAIDGVTIGATTASAATVTTLTSGNITTTGYIAGPSTFTIDPAAVGDNTGTLVVAGNLQVDGTTTTINSTTMTVDDLNITLASGAANAAAANGAGITVDGASATLTYNSTPDAWSFNKNLGIGETDPDTSLHITSTSADQLTLQADSTTIGPNIVFANNDGNLARIASAETNTLRFEVGPSNTEAMRIDSEGRVNIGTGAPDSNITFGIDNQGFIVARYDLSAGVPTAGLGGVFSAAANVTDFSSGDLVLQSRPGVNSRSIKFFTGNTSTERMRIQADGNVGIGTDSPDVKLHIQGLNGAVNPSAYSVIDLAIEDNSEAALGIIGNNYSSIYFGDATNVIQAGIVYNHATDELQLRGSGNTTDLTISSSGHLDLAAGSKIHTTAGIHTNSNTEQLFLTNNGNEASSGVSIVEWGYQHASTGFQGDIHYIVDSRGASGKHRFYEYSGTGWTNLVSIDGSGITFDSGGNYLDDYEEGTFNAYLGFSGGDSGGLNYTNQTFAYTKVGRMVTFTGFLTWNQNNFTSSSGRMYLRGLPFYIISGGSYRGGAGIHYSNSPWTNITVYQQEFRSEDGSTDMTFNFADATDGSIDSEITTHSRIQSSGNFMVSGTYMTS